MNLIEIETTEELIQYRTFHSLQNLVQISLFIFAKIQHVLMILTSGPIFTKGLSQSSGLKLRLLFQVSAQKLLRLWS